VPDLSNLDQSFDTLQAALTLATAAPPCLPDGLEGQTRRAERFAREGLSSCSAENFSGDGEGRALPSAGHPEGAENSRQTLTHLLESLSFVPLAMQSLADMPEATVQDFPGNPLRPSLRTLRVRSQQPPADGLLEHLPVASGLLDELRDELMRLS
jgi:hypothetical protein